MQYRFVSHFLSRFFLGFFFGDASSSNYRFILLAYVYTFRFLPRRDHSLSLHEFLWVRFLCVGWRYMPNTIWTEYGFKVLWTCGATQPFCIPLLLLDVFFSMTIQLGVKQQHFCHQCFQTCLCRLWHFVEMQRKRERVNGWTSELWHSCAWARWTQCKFKWKWAVMPRVNTGKHASKHCEQKHTLLCY